MFASNEIVSKSFCVPRYLIIYDNNRNLESVLFHMLESESRAL